MLLFHKDFSNFQELRTFEMSIRLIEQRKSKVTFICSMMSLKLSSNMKLHLCGETSENVILREGVTASSNHLLKQKPVDLGD